MALLVTSNSVAIILLVILAFSGFITVSRGIGVFYKKRKKFEVFKIQYDSVKDLKSIISSVTAPFTFEVAVSQLGNEKAIYITVPSGRGKSVVDKLNAKKVDDYDLYYPGGTVLGAYAGGSGSLKGISADSIDFSEVNEIGEGVVVQFIFKKKRGRRVTANVRTLVSAPSSYQAKEILNRIKHSLAGLKMTEVKNEDFVSNVNNRVFDGSESVVLSL